LSGFGVDSMQPMLMAIVGIRVHLDRKAPDSFWISGGAGFPLNLPDFSNDKRAEERILFAAEKETIRKWRKRIRAERAKIRAADAKLRKQNRKRKAGRCQGR
jgi:hypothetical protein